MAFEDCTYADRRSVLLPARGKIDLHCAFGVSIQLCKPLAPVPLADAAHTVPSPQLLYLSNITHLSVQQQPGPTKVATGRKKSLDHGHFGALRILQLQRVEVLPADCDHFPARVAAKGELIRLTCRKLTRMQVDRILSVKGLVRCVVVQDEARLCWCYGVASLCKAIDTYRAERCSTMLSSRS